MIPADNYALNQAAELIQKGRKSEARPILERLYVQYPNDFNVLLFFAYATLDLAASRQALTKAAALDPTNPALAKAREWLADEAIIRPKLATYNTARSGATAKDQSRRKPEPPTVSPNVIFRVSRKEKIRHYSALGLEVVAGLTILALIVYMVLTFVFPNSAVQTFVSQEGGFSVQIAGSPASRNENFNANHVSFSQHIFSSTFDFGNMTYSIMYVDLEPAVASLVTSQPRPWLEIFADNMAHHVKGLVKQDLNNGALPGLDFVYEDGNGKLIRGRILYTASRIYGLYYENNGNKKPPLAIQQFIDSFNLTGN